METIALKQMDACQLHTPANTVDWEQVFRLHGKRLQNFIRKRVSNREDVEDLQQMTYLEVLKNREKFAGASRPETWVFGIALNLVRNHFKQARYRAVDISDDALEAMEVLSTDIDPSRITECDHSLNRALTASAHLPEETRKMLMMLLDADVSYQDIAEQLNIPIGTVRSRLSRARGYLRQAVDA
ncbi:RNA polymerase sigma factor [Dickeya fangzhongdai]|uniref:RNA polymerase sigma factor n=1 Tax=Dickeya fangzhongdai TaxID=1778540 RepID=UPI0004F58C02|nr:sigma-70 family RNA polymerase sigma factor [Dickeya fangzhongdai]AIR67754.1 RNA polymerase sigma factor [Dickeya fangzhongdai]KGT96569.1 RNA polymerase sigma factor [Dickeya fangzhongdai]WPD75890.1 sigma-70 family RNA polymerase sigma factor [Dickeya fangzhongdai]